METGYTELKFDRSREAQQRIMRYLNEGPSLESVFPLTRLCDDPSHGEGLMFETIRSKSNQKGGNPESTASMTTEVTPFGTYYTRNWTYKGTGFSVVVASLKHIPEIGDRIVMTSHQRIVKKRGRTSHIEDFKADLKDQYPAEYEGIMQLLDDHSILRRPRCQKIQNRCQTPEEHDP